MFKYGFILLPLLLSCVGDGEEPELGAGAAGPPSPADRDDQARVQLLLPQPVPPRVSSYSPPP